MGELNISLRNRIANDLWPRVPARLRRTLTAKWRRLTYEWTFRYPAPYGVLMSGALAANERRDPRAPDAWRNLIRQFPDRSIGYAGLAGAFRFLGRPDESVEAFKQALDRFPGDAVILWEYGYLLLERGENSAALEAFEQACARAPDRAEAVVGAATALRHLLRFDEADAKLALARERFPGSASSGAITPMSPRRAAIARRRRGVGARPWTIFPAMRSATRV